MENFSFEVIARGSATWKDVTYSITQTPIGTREEIEATLQSYFNTSASIQWKNEEEGCLEVDHKPYVIHLDTPEKAKIKAEENEKWGYLLAIKESTTEFIGHDF